MTTRPTTPNRWQFGLPELFAITAVCALTAAYATQTGSWGSVVAFFAIYIYGTYLLLGYVSGVLPKS